MKLSVFFIALVLGVFALSIASSSSVQRSLQLESLRQRIREEPAQQSQEPESSDETDQQAASETDEQPSDNESPQATNTGATTTGHETPTPAANKDAKQTPPEGTDTAASSTHHNLEITPAADEKKDHPLQCTEADKKFAHVSEVKSAAQQAECLASIKKSPLMHSFNCGSHKACCFDKDGKVVAEKKVHIVYECKAEKQAAEGATTDTTTTSTESQHGGHQNHHNGATDSSTTTTAGSTSSNNGNTGTNSF